MSSLPLSRSNSHDSSVVDVDDLIQARAQSKEHEGKPLDRDAVALMETAIAGGDNINIVVNARDGASTSDDVDVGIDVNGGDGGGDVDIDVNGKCRSGGFEEVALLPKPSSAPNAMKDSKGKERPERRLLLPQKTEEDEEIHHYLEEEGDDDDNYGEDVEGMDDTRVLLKRRLSFMERMQSKFLGPDERKEKLLPQDTFSFLIIAETCGFPFVAALCIFTLQVTTFVLVLLDLAAGGEAGNLFGVPANVSAQLRTTQFIAVLVAVLTQGDLRTAFTLLRDGFTKDFDAAFIETAQWKYRFSIVARAVSGSIGLMVSFVLIVTAPSVVELLLNFTGE